MSVPLKRKVLMWREAAQRAAEVRKRAAQARTGQVVRSTVDVGDTAVPMDEALVGGVEAGEWSAEQQEAIDLLDQDQADSVDFFLDGTGLDIEDQIDAQELADESTLSDADRWEEAAEAEESAHVAHMEAIAVSQAVDGAHAEAKAAAEVAADAKATADGKNARRRGASEPEPPEGGWVQGDQWVRDEDRGGLLVPVEILVWNGTEFVSEQVLANDVLVVGPNGVVQLKDGVVTTEALMAESVTSDVIATNALNAKRIESPEIVGGVIEAPTIVSSAAVGVLANELADPHFESPLDTSWVLSGFLGDSEARQVDTVTWDKSWVWRSGIITSNYRNWGSFIATLVVPPRERQTAGTIIRPNFSWLNKAARTLTNPHKFTDLVGSSSDADHTGGNFDPTFKKIDTRAPLAGTSRTTYLTNANTFTITQGTRWRYKLETTRLTAVQTAFVSSFYLQVISASNNAVVFQYPITKAEMQAGNIVGYWDNTAFNGAVKFRLAITYTAGAGKNTASRKLNAAARAQQTRNGSVIGSQMVPNSGFIDSPYTAYPQKTNGVLYANGTHTPQYIDRINTNMDIVYASFQNVETKSGWRITEANGLETFNSSGFLSGKFNGEDNFFSGRMASREGGARWEIEGDRMSLFGPTGPVLAQLRGVEGGLLFDGPVSFAGDTDWASITAPGATGTCEWMRLAGVIYLRFDLVFNTGLAHSQALAPAFTLPEEAAPSRNTQIAVAGGADLAASGTVWDSGGVRIRNLSGATEKTMRGSGSWPAKL